MSPDPDYDLVSDQKLSRQMMPRIAVPDHERWLAGGLAATEGSTSPQSATPAATLPFAGVVTASAAEPPPGIEQPRRFPAKLSAAGSSAPLMEAAGRHHVSIPARFRFNRAFDPRHA
jgi:hypothetical protein